MSLSKTTRLAITKAQKQKEKRIALPFERDALFLALFLNRYAVTKIIAPCIAT